jgi:hypothetical protein
MRHCALLVELDRGGHMSQAPSASQVMQQQEDHPYSMFLQARLHGSRAPGQGSKTPTCTGVCCDQQTSSSEAQTLFCQLLSLFSVSTRGSLACQGQDATPPSRPTEGRVKAMKRITLAFMMILMAFPDTKAQGSGPASEVAATAAAAQRRCPSGYTVATRVRLRLFRGLN